MSESGAPIVVFAYRRPRHLERTLRSLLVCEGVRDSRVIVYCDGPRRNEEAELVEATRQVARKLLGDAAEYHFSDRNRGLAQSIVSGVGEAVDRFGTAIVIEDDLALHPGFLRYMNVALDRYAHESAVMQISAYLPDVPELNTAHHGIFLPFTTSWGWATWKRAWDHFDPVANGFQELRTNRATRDRFNLNGAYDYSSMLLRQMAGQSDSWAIRWYWSVFRMNGLVLFPPRSLIRNTGLDGSGSHGRGWLRNFAVPLSVPSEVAGDVDMPAAIAVDSSALDAVVRAMRRQNGGRLASWIDRVSTWLQ